MPRSGNTITWSYINDKHPTEGYTQEVAPWRIAYTGHPTLAPSRAVQFVYEKREKPSTRTLFARGMALTRSRMLSRVEMLVGPADTKVREYRFSYVTAPATKRMLLSQVEECAADGLCKPATRFDWHHGSGPGFVELATPLLPPESDLASMMLADITGDGLDDIVIPDVDMTGGSEQPITDWYVAPNKSAEVTPGYFDGAVLAHQEVHGDIPFPVQPERGTPLNYDHNGRMDVLLHDLHGQFANWRILLSKPDHTFAMQDTGILRPFPLGVVPPLALASPDASAHLVDASGDGMTDLLQCAFDGAGYAWFIHLWTPEAKGFDPKGSKVEELFHYPCNAEMHVVDIDADSKVDLLVHGATITSDGPLWHDDYDALSLQGASGTWTRTPTQLSIVKGSRLLFLDVTGDGLPDAVEIKSDTAAKARTSSGFRYGRAIAKGAIPNADAALPMSSARGDHLIKVDPQTLGRAAGGVTAGTAIAPPPLLTGGA